MLIASEKGAVRRDRQAQRGNRSSEMLRITLRRATGGERSSEMRRTTHTVQQKIDIGKRKLATVRQKCWIGGTSETVRQACSRKCEPFIGNA